MHRKWATSYQRAATCDADTLTSLPMVFESTKANIGSTIHQSWWMRKGADKLMRRLRKKPSGFWGIIFPCYPSFWKVGARMLTCLAPCQSSDCHNTLLGFHHDVWGVNVLWLLCRLGSRVCTLQFHVSPVDFMGRRLGWES